MSEEGRRKCSAEAFIPLIAGGVGGTAGAILTCPLEVVKTRLQSSNSGFPSSPEAIAEMKRLKARGSGGPAPRPPPDCGGSGGGGGSGSAGAVKIASNEVAAEKRAGRIQTSMPVTSSAAARTGGSRRFAVPPALTQQQQRHHQQHHYALPRGPQQNMNVLQCIRFIYVTEGVFGLFKGLGPNLMGVAPSRAIYFWAYSTVKSKINALLPGANRDTPFVHVVSAMSAGFSASTTTNPIWLIKTRLQLDPSSGKNTLSIRKCCRLIYKEKGFLGFWGGVTASYWGISETVIHFVIYEALKKRLEAYKAGLGSHTSSGMATTIDVFGYMLCGACSKACATCIAYPHEVARTRLREHHGDRYKSFWQTLGVVYRDEGRRGLYRGLGTQLVRQIPNTAIMMSTYELTVALLTRWLNSSDALSSHRSSLACDLRDAAADADAATANAILVQSEGPSRLSDD